MPHTPEDTVTDEHSTGPDPRVLLAWERTHLATQRTILAWTRTSIAFLAFGVALAKFGLFISLFSAREHLEAHGLPPGVPDPRVTDYLGAALVFVGVLHSLIGVVQSSAMREGPERFASYKVWSVRASAMITFIAGIGLLTYLVAI